MKINDTNVYLKDEEKLLLQDFFSENIEFLKNNSLIEYENIKAFGDLYEQFIDEHDLRKNDMLMLFLAEVRYDQLSYKITAKSNKMNVARMAQHSGRIRLNDTVRKWYEEITTVTVERGLSDESLEKKLQENKIMRQSAWTEAAKKILK